MKTMRGLTRTMRKALGEYKRLAEKAMRLGMTVYLTADSKLLDMTIFLDAVRDGERVRTRTSGTWYQEFGSDTVEAREKRLEERVEYINEFIEANV